MPSKLWWMRICRCPQSSISTINCVHFEPGDMTMTIMNDGPTNICIREASDKWSQICRNAVTVPGHTSCRQTPGPGHFNTHQFSGKRLTFRDKLEHLSLDCLLRLYFVMTLFLQLSDGESCIDSGRGVLDIDNNEKGFIVF